MARRWWRFSTGNSRPCRSRVTGRRSVRRVASRPNSPSRRRGRAIRGTCSIRPTRLPPGRLVAGTDREIVPRLTWTPKPSTTRTTVHAGRLFDGRTTRENVDIVIEGTRIARVEAHRADLHGGTVVDASNGTVLPGLIESHAHLSPGVRRTLRPYLARLRHHHRAQSCGRRVRGATTPRGLSSLERSLARAGA